MQFTIGSCFRAILGIVLALGVASCIAAEEEVSNGLQSSADEIGEIEGGQSRRTTPLDQHVMGGLAPLVLDEDVQTVVVDPYTTVTAEGALLVADREEHQVRYYEPDGTLRWRFGRRGRGPTDLLQPLRAVWLPDSTVFVTSYASHDALWEAGGDSVRYTLPQRSIRLPMDAVALGHRLVARGMRSRFRPDTTLKDPLVEVLRAADGDLVQSFFIPEVRGLTLQAVGLDGFVKLASRGDTLAVVYSLGTAIHLFSSEGRLLDTVPIPFVRLVRPEFTTEEFIEKVTDLTIDYTAIESLYWLKDGSFVLEIRDRREGPGDVSWHVLRLDREGRFLFEAPVARLRTVDPQALRIYVQDPDYLEPNRWLVGELSPADG